MTVTASAVKRWKVQVAERSTGLQLSGVCPQCGTEVLLNLQPLPWSVPELPPEPMEPGPARRAWQDSMEAERRTVRGIPHREASEVVTELWCHRDGVGTEVTVSLTD